MAGLSVVWARDILQFDGLDGGSPAEENPSTLGVTAEECARRVSRRIARGTSLSSEDLGDVFVELMTIQVCVSSLSPGPTRSSSEVVTEELVAEDGNDGRVLADGCPATGPPPGIVIQEVEGTASSSIGGSGNVDTEVADEPEDRCISALSVTTSGIMESGRINDGILSCEPKYKKGSSL